MIRIASKMKLLPGFTQEYRRRHDEIWPELKAVLFSSGIQEYSIYLDVETLTLFAFLLVEEENEMSELPAKEIMQRWWACMKDIMETNADNSPVNIVLEPVFYLSKTKTGPVGPNQLTDYADRQEGHH